MTYRTIERDGQTFHVRISDEAFNRWLERRAALMLAGVPDRPPDVDADALEQWLPHPGEEEHPYFRTGTMAARVAEANEDLPVPLAVYSWRNGERRTIVVLAALHGTGGYDITYDREHEPTHTPEEHHVLHVPAFATDEETDAKLTELLELVCDNEGAASSIAVPSTFTYIEAEQELAEADITETFGTPGPIRPAVMGAPGNA